MHPAPPVTRIRLPAYARSVLMPYPSRCRCSRSRGTSVSTASGIPVRAESTAARQQAVFAAYADISTGDGASPRTARIHAASSSGYPRSASAQPHAPQPSAPCQRPALEVLERARHALGRTGSRAPAMLPGRPRRRTGSSRRTRLGIRSTPRTRRRAPRLARSRARTPAPGRPRSGIGAGRRNVRPPPSTGPRPRPDRTANGPPATAPAFTSIGRAPAGARPPRTPSAARRSASTAG